MIAYVIGTDCCYERTWLVNKPQSSSLQVVMFVFRFVVEMEISKRRIYICIYIYIYIFFFLKNLRAQTTYQLQAICLASFIVSVLNLVTWPIFCFSLDNICDIASARKIL
jgi:hypothetical protein